MVVSQAPRAKYKCKGTPYEFLDDYDRFNISAGHSELTFHPLL